MEVTIWTLTTEGDNAGVETSVHPSQEFAQAELLASLPDAPKEDEDATAAWERLMDGPAIIEEHTIAVPTMTVVRAKMLSEALTQYIDNARDPDEQTLAERVNLVLAQAMLDEANVFLADAAKEA
jgi:hypothetical protein